MQSVCSCHHRLIAVHRAWSHTKQQFATKGVSRNFPRVGLYSGGFQSHFWIYRGTRAAETRFLVASMVKTKNFSAKWGGDGPSLPMAAYTHVCSTTGNQTSSCDKSVGVRWALVFTVSQNTCHGRRSSQPWWCLQEFKLLLCVMYVPQQRVENWIGCMLALWRHSISTGVFWLFPSIGVWSKTQRFTLKLFCIFLFIISVQQLVRAQ